MDTPITRTGTNTDHLLKLPVCKGSGGASSAAAAIWLMGDSIYKGNPIGFASSCSLGHAEIVDLLNALPTVTIPNELTLTGNPGISELTDEEKTIATGKGWTLTL